METPSSELCSSRRDKHVVAFCRTNICPTRNTSFSFTYMDVHPIATECKFPQFLPRDAMSYIGLYQHAVSVRPSVCPSVCHVRGSCQKNKDIFDSFIPSGSHTILVFPQQTGWRYSDGNPPNGGVECRWGRQKNAIPDEYMAVLDMWCLQHMYRVTLIGVFLGHFRINLHQTRTQYSNEGPQHWTAAQFPKKRFLNVEFCRRKTVVLTFLRCVSSRFAAMSKNQ